MHSSPSQPRSRGWWYGISNRKKLTVAAAAIVLLAAVLLVSQANPSVDSESYPVRVKLVPFDQTSGNFTWGADLADNAVDFGRLPAHEVQSQRDITVRNSGQATLNLDVAATGNVSRFLTLETTTLALQPGEARNITVTLEADNTSTPGLYTGTVIVKSSSSVW